MSVCVCLSVFLLPGKSEEAEELLIELENESNEEGGDEALPTALYNAASTFALFRFFFFLCAFILFIFYNMSPSRFFFEILINFVIFIFLLNLFR